MSVSYDLHSSILLIIAFSNDVIFNNVVFKRKLYFWRGSLFIWYGPFYKKTSMAYLTLQTIVQSLLLVYLLWFSLLDLVVE